MNTKEYEYGQSNDVDYEGELVTDYYPVLVYRVPEMTDEQAEAIQNFTRRIMEQGTVIPTKGGDGLVWDDVG